MMRAKSCMYGAGLITFLFITACQPNIEVSPIESASVQAIPDKPTPTVTMAPTTSQEVLSIPTSTRDYVNDLEYYLTPYPRMTPRPTSTPQMSSSERDTLFAGKISDLLAEIEIRTVPTAQLSIPPRLTQTVKAEVEYVQVATDLMNITQGDQDSYLEYVLTWVPGTKLDDLGSVWIYSDDLDQDGATEWLVSVPLRRRALRGGQPPGHAKQMPQNDDWIGCSPGFHCPRMIVLFEYVEGMFEPAHVLISRSFDVTELGVWFNTPAVILTEDLNLNGIPEILLESKWHGASTSGSELFIGEWDGKNWHSLGWINKSFAEFTFEDWNQDGFKDILVHGEGTGSGIVIQRRHTIVYGWEQNWYVQIADIPDPDSHPYFRIIDANMALRENDPQTALVLAESALGQFKNQECSAIVEHANIIAYAGIESMLAKAMSQDNVTLDFPEVLKDMEDACQLGDNPYVEAAYVLQAAYDYTQNPITACLAMEHYVLDRRDEGIATHLIPAFFEKATTAYAWEWVQNLCPLPPQF